MHKARRSRPRKPDRDWRIDPKAPLGAELARVLHAQCAGLRHHALSAEGLAKRVHRTRRIGKRLRALLRLVRPLVGERRFRLWSREVRDLGRRVSTVRDAEVLDATWSAIGLDGADRATASILRHRAQRAEAEVARSRALEAVAARIAVLEGRMAAVLPARVLEGALEQGVAAAYRRARRQWRIVQEVPGVEELHELRKRVKVVLAQVELLRDFHPRVSGPIRRTLDRLGKELGAEHDLAVLDAFLRRRPGRPPRVVAAVRKRREVLRRRALRHAKQTLEDRPADFARRIVGPP